jgi:hypothetical protein
MGPRRQSIEFSRLSVRPVGREIARLCLAGVAWLLVHFRCLYATAVEERPSGWRVEPGSCKRVGVSRPVCTRSHLNRSCQHVPAFALGRGASRGGTGMTSLLGSPAVAETALAFNVAHCRFGGE